MGSKVDMVVGLQWGDEGKGEEIARLSKPADIVIRCMGGNNAGHTVVINGKAIAFHLLPSSVAWGKQIGIGGGVVADPLALINEVKYTQSFGINPLPNLVIDGRCSLVMFYHRIMDMAGEIIRARSSEAIDTTARGIGPAYADIANRSAIRMSDLVRPGWSAGLSKLIKRRVAEKLRIFQSMGLTTEEWHEIFVQLTQKEQKANQRLLDQGLIEPVELDYTRFDVPGDIIDFNWEEVDKAYNRARKVIMGWGCVSDVSSLLRQAIRDGKRVMIEGAQGAHLDNRFGTWRYVTASFTTSGGACVGLGIPPTVINEVRGIAKAYTTRVGFGPFPTKDDELAARIRGDGTAIGDEFGATTGRPRDCGWFDAVLVRSGCWWSGVTKMTLSKLDKLTGLEQILVARAWRVGGKEFLFVPADYALAEDPTLEVEYLTVPGWDEDISTIRKWGDLPANAHHYVHLLEALTNEGAVQPIRIDRIGVGPSEEQVIERPV